MKIILMEDIVLRHDHEQVLSLLSDASDYVRAYKCQCNPPWSKDDASRLLRKIDDALSGRNHLTPNAKAIGASANDD